MSSITKLKAREILDSRGNPTIEVDLFSKNISATASVSSGASTGRYEAWELRDDTERYNGKGVQHAVKNAETKIFPRLKGKDCTKQKEIDQLLLNLDHTKNKSNLGANTMLAVSLANAKLSAETKKIPLYHYLNQLVNLNNKLKIKPMLPLPFFNIINGGKHAGSGLAFQEFMIVPRARTFSEALQMSSEIYHNLKYLLEQKFGRSAINVGDEGGFAPPLKNAEEALDLLEKAVHNTGYSKKVSFAIDVAASEFYEKGKYNLAKFSAHHHLPHSASVLTTEKLLDYYLHLIKKYPIISIEDPFEQNDFASYAKLKQLSNIQIVGDDLTVTNVNRIQIAINENSCNCLLLKVNQIGTLTEALDAVKLAYQNNWKVMVSHRSGETEDTFIADLAVGIGCGMIKAGAPCRGERVAKYNRLLRIEELVHEKNF